MLIRKVALSVFLSVYRLADDPFEAAAKRFFGKCLTARCFQECKLTYVEHDEKMKEMVALLRETNALREPIRQLKGTVDDIFKSIKGPSPTTLYLRTIYLP